jgi:tetratricopeptide (TPR) repeat protein
VLTLGERWLAGGRPDSALRWAEWASEGFGRIARAEALDLAARSEMRAGRPDSALAVWNVILVEFERDPDATASARFSRAEALEATDRWTQARTELSALCAAQPTHPRALDAWVRVVTHYRREGEIELARIEAEHALGTFTLLLTSQHDPGVRRRVGEARVGVLLALGRTREAIEALREVWSGEGVSPAGAILGAQAARNAGSELHDEALARSLWQILAERAPDPEVRREAAAALERRPS